MMDGKINKEPLKDALGNLIIYGNRYGYSMSSNGITTVKIGIALLETKANMVQLEVESAATAVFTANIRPTTFTAKKISVKSNTLFPIITKEKTE